MKENTKSKLFFLLFIMFCTTTFGQDNAKFKVVLDPGHGGKDFGAIYHGFVEKNIALNVALKVGKLLEQDDNVQVIFTRKTDVFIELTERPNIANKNDADVFVSIHCNGEAKKAAFGTETFIMGPTKNASNLEVARAENSVITLEKDYKVKYAGFDVNSPETIIGIGIQQEANINQSIDLASKVQDGFTNGLKRKNRGVKYAPFWVLHKTAMPSILIELGFLSYQQEGAFLNTDEGQDDMAKMIAKAILSYKKEFFAGGGSNDTKEPVAAAVTPRQQPVEVKQPVETPVAAATASNEGVVFKVQISASGRSLDTTPANFKGLNNITKDASTSVIKYFYGATSQYSEAKELLEQAKAKGFTSAFVVAFRDGKKITVQEALSKN
ncbi:N-acetylmuramoyl-L-alanine amidase [Flavobacterium sp. Sd200]|uniref:N-acetylmuramoyl-L-alanine amidase family protein n=1 Tax=Flavobacterium sp. Sd200 TaxID=2692211 RepID=UPI0013721FDC|nr:N-acetylmuramoyl-L-alanine amidase [Flavobacterium sp. Sd200]MXN90636.1 N-acetylmuramoyl-L-alanine amidase [Flavobacterium sp. Sd200]